MFIQRGWVSRSLFESSESWGSRGRYREVEEYESNGVTVTVTVTVLLDPIALSGVHEVWLLFEVLGPVAGGLAGLAALLLRGAYWQLMFPLS